jgi:hypothetical protein
MKGFRTAGSLGLILGIAAGAAGTGVAAGSRQAAARSGLWDTAKIEAFLRKGPIVEIRKDLEIGRTLSWTVSLDDGTTKGRALFKYVHRPRPAAFADCYEYELAAYELNRMLGLDIVPPTVARKINGNPGALQWRLEGCLTERDRERSGLQPPDLDVFLKRLEEIRIFEFLVNDECQDKDDTLIHKDNWAVCRVDFSEAFGPGPAIEDACPFARCSRRLFEGLSETTRRDFARRLQPYLSGAELGDLWNRRGWIVGRIRKLIEEKGERAVLY